MEVLILIHEACILAENQTIVSIIEMQFGDVNKSQRHLNPHCKRSR